MKSFVAANRWDPGERDYAGNQVLQYAAQSGNAEMIRLLVSGGSDPQSTNSDQKIPIQLAEEAGNAEAAQTLRELGATR